MNRETALLFINDYIRNEGERPNFARCMIQWKDDQALSNATIALFAFGEQEVPKELDDNICFYAGSIEGFLDLADGRYNEDFWITKIYSVSKNMYGYELCEGKIVRAPQGVA